MEGELGAELRYREFCRVWCVVRARWPYSEIAACVVFCANLFLRAPQRGNCAATSFVVAFVGGIEKGELVS